MEAIWVAAEMRAGAAEKSWDGHECVISRLTWCADERAVPDWVVFGMTI